MESVKSTSPTFLSQEWAITLQDKTSVLLSIITIIEKYLNMKKKISTF